MQAELRKPESTGTGTQVMGNAGVEHGIHEHSILYKFGKSQYDHNAEGDQPEGGLGVLQYFFQHKRRKGKEAKVWFLFVVCNLYCGLRVAGCGLHVQYSRVDGEL